MPLNATTLITFVYCVFCACFICSSTAKTEATSREVSGPYITTLKRVGNCKSSTTAYMRNPPMVLDISITKNNALKGNLTVIGNYYGLKIIYREYYYEDGKWQLTFNVDNVSCRNRLMGVLANSARVKYNKKTCSAPKASFPFEVEYNRLDHLMMPERQYGRMLRTVELRGKAGVVLCIELEAVVKPVKA